MNETHRYFRICDLHNNAKHSGAKPERLERLKALEEHQAEAARQAMRTPFTIADLFAAFNKEFKSN